MILLQEFRKAGRQKTGEEQGVPDKGGGGSGVQCRAALHNPRFHFQLGNPSQSGGREGAGCSGVVTSCREG